MQVYETRDIAEDIGAFEKRIGKLTDYKVVHDTQRQGWQVVAVTPVAKRKTKKPGYIIKLRKKVKPA